MKETKEPLFRKFDELKNELPPILYNSQTKQIIPFLDERSTSQGAISVRVGHILKPLSDERFIEREKEFSEQNKNKSLLERTLPTEKLWSDLVESRIGYKPRDDWRNKVKNVDKIRVIAALTQIVDVEEEVEEWAEYLIDEDDLVCLKFNVFYGGIDLSCWIEWLITGKLPENIKFLDEESYERVCGLVRKGISPSVLLEVKHYFNEPTAAQMDEFLSISTDAPNKSKLASAAKSALTSAERLANLFDEISAQHEGYDSPVPIWHKGKGISVYLFNQLARMGK